jgi:hypothetical protein
MKSLIVKRVGAIAAGDTVLWTPSAGLRVQLLGYSVGVPQATTAAPNVSNSSYIRDNGVDIFDIFDMSTAAATSVPLAYSVALEGNGYIQGADNTSLVIHNVYAYTTGGVVVTAWGYEI